jgi:cell division protein FtsA
METWMSNHRSLIFGLDIGSTHVTAILAEATPENFKIIGLGKAQNKGIKHGSIVDIAKTTEAIKKAKEAAEEMSGRYVTSAWVSCGGMHVRSMDSNGMLAIESGEVTKSDLERVIKTAQSVVLPDDQQVLHVLPKEFFIDGYRGIRNPIGIRGLRLEVDVHMITGNKSYFPNATKCVELAGLKVKGFVLQQLASSMAVMTEDEKELGSCLVDIGGGTTDIICYKDGAVIHTASIPIGGNHFTQDLSIGLRTSPSDAEKIKIKYGHCLPQSSELDEMVEVPNVGDTSFRTISRKNICQIIEPRADEVYKLIFDHLDKEKLIKKMNAGLVLTGGSSSLKGFVDLGRYNYDVPIRLGIPVANSGIKESLSTSDMAAAVGLMHYGYEKIDKNDLVIKAKKDALKASGDNFINSITKQFKDYFG